MAKLRFPISLLISEADHITNAFTANSAAMTARLAAPYNADTIALMATVIAQGAAQASAGADLGDLTAEQEVAMTTLLGRIKMARDTAKRAFKGQTVKLHEEFQVGSNGMDLDSVMERGGIISASIKRAENIAPLTAKGWIAADTTAFDAALLALDSNEDSQEAAKAAKLGTTATRAENADTLYERLLTIQNAARLEFPEEVANTEVRASFRLDVFPPPGEEELELPEQATLTLEDLPAPGQVSMSMAALYATTMKLYVMHPGTAVWALYADNLPTGLYVAMELPAGEYQFKAVGNNELGDGPESEAFSVTVS